MTLRTLELPPHAMVVKLADPDSITDDEDIEYNAWCTAKVTAELLDVRESGMEPPLLKTHYPFDAPDGSTDDTVSLDRDGLVVIVDGGAA